MKCIALLSGGIDSPVAYYIMKNKMECIAIHFLMDGKEKVRNIMKLIKGKIYFVPYEEIKKEILKVKKSYRCIICKRFMYKIAEEFAKKEKADIIVTGENLGQVASQTLDSLMAIEEAVDLPVIRPLIAMDKEDIINIAKKIGTYDISIKNQYKCKLAPKKPVTRAKLDRVLEEENKIDKNAIIKAIGRCRLAFLI